MSQVNNLKWKERLNTIVEQRVNKWKPTTYLSTTWKGIFNPTPSFEHEINNLVHYQQWHKNRWKETPWSRFSILHLEQTVFLSKTLFINCQQKWSSSFLKIQLKTSGFLSNIKSWSSLSTVSHSLGIFISSLRSFALGLHGSIFCNSFSINNTIFHFSLNSGFVNLSDQPVSKGGLVIPEIEDMWAKKAELPDFKGTDPLGRVVKGKSSLQNKNPITW